MGSLSQSATPSEAASLDGANVDLSAVAETGGDLSFANDGLSERINAFNGMLETGLVAFRLGEQTVSIHYTSDGFYYPVGPALVIHSGDRPWNYTRAGGVNGLPQGWNRPWFAEWTTNASAGTASIRFADGHREAVLGVVDTAEIEHEALPQSELVTSGGGRWGFANAEKTRTWFVDANGMRYVFDHGLCTQRCYPSSVEDRFGNGVRVAYYERTLFSGHEILIDEGIPRVVTSYRTAEDGTHVPLARAFFYARGVRDTGAEPGILAPQMMIESIVYPGPTSNPLARDASWHTTRFAYFDHAGNSQAIASVPRVQLGCEARFEDHSEISAIEVEGRSYRFEYGGGCPQQGTGRQLGRLARVTLPHGQLLQYEYQTYAGLSPFGPLLDYQPRNNLPRNVGVSINVASLVGQGLATGDWVGAVIGSIGISIQARLPRNLPPRALASRTFVNTLDGQSYAWQLRHFATAEHADVGSGDAHFVVGVVTTPTGSSTAYTYHQVAPENTAQSAKAGLLASIKTYDYRAYPYATRVADALPQSPVAQTDFGYATFALGSTLFDGPHQSRSTNQVAWLHWVARPAFQVSGRHARVGAAAEPSACCLRGVVAGQTLYCQTNNAAADSLTPVCIEGDWEDAPEPAIVQYHSRLYSSAGGERSVLCSPAQGNSNSPRCPDQATTIDYDLCEALGPCAPYTDATYATRAVVTLHRNDAPSRYGLHTFSGTARGDYDQDGNAPFARTFSTDNYRIRRSATFGSPPCVSVAGLVGNDRDPWRCQALSTKYQQDSLIVDGTPTDGSETRYQYVSEDAAQRTLYLTHNQTHLLASETRCELGSSCAQGAGLLSRTEYAYDNEIPYPYADAPGDHSTEKFGRLTSIRRVLLSNPNESPRRAINYYARADVAQNGGGSVAEVADLDNEEFDSPWARQRFAYGDNAAIATVSPTQTWHIDWRNRVWPLGTASYNTWGQPLTLNHENGERTHTCYDDHGRVRANFAAQDVFSGCPTSDADAIEGAGETLLYQDTGVERSVLAITRVRANGQLVSQMRSALFFDGVGRPFQYRAERVEADGSTRVLGKTLRYRAHTEAIEAETETLTLATDLMSIDRVAEAGRIDSSARVESRFDALGRVVETAEIAGMTRRVSRTEYPQNQPTLLWNEVRFTDASGRTSMERTDVFGRVTTTRTRSGDELGFSYDRAGNLSSIVHPDGLTSSREFDSLGRVVAETAPESGTTRTQYNRASQSTSIWQANGDIAYMNYDSRRRLTSRSERPAGAGRDTPVAGYQYDEYSSGSPVASAHRRGLGRLVAATSGLGVVHHGYDLAGGIAERVVDSAVGRKRIEHTSDSEGQVRSIRYQNGADDALEVAYQYDNNGDLSALRASVAERDLGELFAIQRDPQGHVTRRNVLMQNGAALQQEDFQYDDFGVLRAYNNPDALGDDAFAYRIRYEDAVQGAGRNDGLPSEIEWARRGASRASYRYAYDARQNLTGADFHEFDGNAWQNPSRYDFSARYDSVGSTLHMERNDAQGTASATDFDYDRATRRLRSTQGGLNSQFAYDGSGNVTENSEWGGNSRVEYNASSRPRAVSAGIRRMSLGYDEAMDVSHIETAELERCGRGSCYATREITDVIRDVDGAAIAEYKDGALVRLNLPGVGYYIPTATAQATPGIRSGVHVVLGDHVGSTRVILHESGTVLEGHDYDPFGQELSERAFTTESDQYDSFATYRQRNDFDAPFYLAGARLYHPGLGRFLAADPFARADLLRNAYNYAMNVPNVLNDPSGLCPVEWNCLPELLVTASRLPSGWQKVGAVVGGLVVGIVLTAVIAAAVVASPVVATIAATVALAGAVYTLVNYNEIHKNTTDMAMRFHDGEATADDYYNAGFAVGGAVGARPGVRIGGQVKARVAARAAARSAARDAEVHQFANNVQSTNRDAETRQFFSGKDAYGSSNESKMVAIVGETNHGIAGNPTRINSEVAAAYDNVPTHLRAPGHGHCAETHAMSSFADSHGGVAGLRGQEIRVLGVGGPNGTRHGANFSPCSSCQHVLHQLGVRYVPTVQGGVPR